MTKSTTQLVTKVSQRSRSDLQDKGKRIIKRVCPDCWGSGYQIVDHRKSTCPKCHGTGQIEEEIEVRD